MHSLAPLCPSWPSMCPWHKLASDVRLSGPATQAAIAQLAARRSHNPKVVNSILTHRTICISIHPNEQGLWQPVWTWSTVPPIINRSWCEASPHRLVVRTSRCGRDNPGSTPGEDIICVASMNARPSPATNKPNLLATKHFEQDLSSFHDQASQVARSGCIVPSDKRSCKGHI